MSDSHGKIHLSSNPFPMVLTGKNIAISRPGKNSVATIIYLVAI